MWVGVCGPHEAGRGADAVAVAGLQAARCQEASIAPIERGCGAQTCCEPLAFLPWQRIGHPHFGRWRVDCSLAVRSVCSSTVVIALQAAQSTLGAAPRSVAPPSHPPARSIEPSRCQTVADMAAELAGAPADRYELRDLVGRGSFGAVHRG